MMRLTGIFAATALSLALPIATMAQDGSGDPEITLTQEQAERLAELRAEGEAFDPRSDPRAYRTAFEAVRDYALTIYPPDHPEIAMIEGEIDFAYFMLGELSALPERLFAQRDIYAAAGPEWREKYIETVNNLAVLYNALGDSQTAIGYQRQAVELWRDGSPAEGSGQLAQGLANLAWSERGLGNDQSAFDLNAEALAMIEPLLLADPTNIDLAHTYVTATGNHAMYVTDLRDPDAGWEVLRGGIVRASELLGPDHPQVAYMMLSASSMLIQSGQYSAGEDMARGALRIREAAFGAESPAASEARVNLVLALVSQRRYEDALPLAEYTVARLTESQGAQAPFTLDARSKLADIYRRLGRAEEGFAETESVLAAYRAIRPVGHADITWELQRLAVGYARAGRWSEAASHLAELEAVWRDTAEQFRPPFAGTLALRSLVETRLGNNEAARAYLEEAQPMLLADFRREVENEGAAGGMNVANDLALGWATSASRSLGLDARGFDLAQYMGVGPSERGLLRARQREAAADPVVASALRERQDLLEQRETLLAEFQESVSAGDTETAASLYPQIQRLDEELAVSGQTENLPLLTAASASEIQGRLAADAALLFIVESDIETHIFVVTSDRLISDSAAATTLQIGRHVADLRASIERGAGVPYDIDTAQDLQAALFTPSVREALEGRTNISVIARGELAKLPFSILIDPDGRYMLETTAFSYPITLDAVGENSGEGAPVFASFLGIGAPDLPGVAQSERSFPDESDNATIAALGRLEFAEGELSALSEAVGAEDSRIMVGPGATETAMRNAEIGRADFLTFATHGLMAGELAGVEEASLVLTPPADGEMATTDNDGLLTASEIASFDLNARWVVLSACNSASGNGADDEAFGGLAQAFLFAGADALLVSHWRVRDDAAAFLTVATARGAASGIPAAESLRQAQLELMGSASVRDAQHPAIWAPFVYVGS